jgi:DNA (cytosine-5)-methyltransferase 1
MRVIDLFSGCGGMSLGFQNAGFDIQAAYDNWPAANKVYEKNFNHPIHELDLTDVRKAVSEISKYKPDLIMGGPPCQDFSIAGPREENKRANLTKMFAEIVVSVRPKWVVMENVYNIEKSEILPVAKAILKEAGYGISASVLDASYTNVPQARRRYFLIGKLCEQDDFLKKDLKLNLSTKQMTVFDYFGDKLNTEFYYVHPRSYRRRAVFSIYEPSSTIRGVNRPIPKTYKRHPADKAGISDAVRPLTTKERSQVQTFPESFSFDGSKTQVEQMIGNAVPVRLAEYVALRIREYAS